MPALFALNHPVRSSRVGSSSFLVWFVHTRIRLNAGKTRVWNAAGVAPADIQQLPHSAKVWVGRSALPCIHSKENMSLRNKLADEHAGCGRQSGGHSYPLGASTMACQAALVHRWSGFLTAATMQAFAASLFTLPSPGLSCLDGLMSGLRRPLRTASQQLSNAGFESPLGLPCCAARAPQRLPLSLPLTLRTRSWQRNASRAVKDHLAFAFRGPGRFCGCRASLVPSRHIGLTSVASTAACTAPKPGSSLASCRRTKACRG